MSRRATRAFIIERHRLLAELSHVDRSKWYSLDDLNMLDVELQEKFFQCSLDEETEQFIANCERKTGNCFYAMWLYFLRSILSIFFHYTPICGLLNHGLMFVFSDNQLRKFVFDSIDQHRRQIRRQENDSSSLIISDHPPDNYGTLLDIGAGDGNVTKKFEKYFQKIYATELSHVMQYRLRSKGFTLLDADEWPNATENDNRIHFDVISLLNVLDRCDRPLQMLKNIHQTLLESDGYLILALVLPFAQYVEYKNSHNPEEELMIDGQTFEEQVTSFYQNVLKPLNFEVIKWTKLPYLSEGSITPFSWLIDSVFLLKPYNSHN